jgi:hypothetical protein
MIRQRQGVKTGVRGVGEADGRRWRDGDWRVRLRSRAVRGPVRMVIDRVEGWVAERLNAPVLKTGSRESGSWVRIPPHPHSGFAGSGRSTHETAQTPSGSRGSDVSCGVLLFPAASCCVKICAARASKWALVFSSSRGPRRRKLLLGALMRRPSVMGQSLGRLFHYRMVKNASHSTPTRGIKPTRLRGEDTTPSTARHRSQLVRKCR